MDRDKTIKGLLRVRGLLSMLLPPPQEEIDILRDVIALLRVPEVAEIEAARKWAGQWEIMQEPKTCLCALDALARESQLQELVRGTAPECDENTALRAVVDGQRLKIAALEAKLARVQAVLEKYGTPWNQDVAMVLRDFRAAIADVPAK